MFSISTKFAFFLSMEETIAHIKQTRDISSQEFPVKSLFLAKYGQLPRRLIITPQTNSDGSIVVFHVKSLLDRIKVQNESAIIRQYFHRCSQTYFIREQLISLADINGVMLYINCCDWVINYTNNSKKSIQPDYIPKRHFLTVDQIKLFYLSEHDEFVKKLANDLIHDDTLYLSQPKIAELRLIGKYKDTCIGPGSFYLMGNIRIKKPYINNLAISYGGEDFLKIHEKILVWLHKKDTSGLVLLHGAPGCGKYNN